MTLHVPTELSDWLGSGSINIFGRPFAGKDTQGQILREALNGVLLGGGDILRGSIIPEKSAEALRRGHLIPSEDFVDIVLPYLSKAEFHGKPLLLSSVGRWKGEEEGVLSALESAQHTMKAVIHLELNENEVRKRWSALHHVNDRGNRADDTEEILEERLVEYRNKTIPVLETYEKMGLLIKVDGNQSKEAVTQQIIENLLETASKHHISSNQ